jgi:uncharacterized ferritin-like protein (DUF455 family)
MSSNSRVIEMRRAALSCLAETDASIKTQAVAALADAWQRGAVTVDTQLSCSELQQVEARPVPGQPAKPTLVPPLLVKRRAMNTVAGRAALIHALTHIEFNAINLALDAIWRFAGMPEHYYRDWLQVATEEARHFALLNAHLQQLGFNYGDFDAHDSLWQMVDKTKADVLARMALVPRTMEARGLDALPALRAKLAQAGDMRAAQILDITLADEVGHVAIGNIWFNWLCAQQGLEALSTFERLCVQYVAPKLRGPFNLEARRQAGFTEAELETLSAL